MTQITQYEHSGRKRVYKIEGKYFNNCGEIAEKYSCNINTARSWVSKKRTPEGEMINKIVLVDIEQ